MAGGKIQNPASSSPGWNGEEARKDRGLTLDRLLVKVGPEAASPGACTGTARSCQPQPCLGGDGTVRLTGDGAVVLREE
jgi:hypothetical protein